VELMIELRLERDRSEEGFGEGGRRGSVRFIPACLALSR